MSNAARVHSRRVNQHYPFNAERARPGTGSKFRCKILELAFAQSDMGCLFQNFGQANSWYVYQIRWDRSRLGVSVKNCARLWRWNLGDQRAWPWIVLFSIRVLAWMS